MIADAKTGDAVTDRAKALSVVTTRWSVAPLIVTFASGIIAPDLSVITPPRPPRVAESCWP